MILQYASDLHLEFPVNRAFLDLHPLQPLGDVLILAGDIVPFAIMDKHADFFNYLSDHFKTTYWIPGNHEYYHSDIAMKSGTLNEKIRTNVFLVNNITIEYENIEFIFSTLWSKISPEHESKLEQAMNDFRQIEYKNQLFTPQQLNELNLQCVLFLTLELGSNKLTKKIVVTHHIPTFNNAPAKYRGSILHEAMGVELSELIEKTSPDYWIYGHVHRNHPGFKVGNTMLLTNQMGYVLKGEQSLFKTNKTITV